METQILHGKSVAEKIKTEVLHEISQLQGENLSPGLAAVLVGENPVSRVYVGSKTRTCKELGMYSKTVELPDHTSTSELLKVIDLLNREGEIDGILVQLPLPDQIDEETVLSAVDPAKDVDGFHPVNVGKLCAGKTAMAPCTPLGIMELLKNHGIDLRGAEAVVVGRSNIVGKPMALLLLHEHATVTLCHSRTRNLAAVCRRADLLVAAVGRPALLTQEHLREGVIVVDVGINRINSMEEGIRLFGEDSKRIDGIREKGYTLVGDVHPVDPMGIAAAVTPVPGGVGPLTIAQLMKNTVAACRMRRGKPHSRVQP